MSSKLSNNLEYIDSDYEDLRKYYDELGSRQRELRIKQDQLIVTLTTATLLFSVGFVKDIVTVEKAVQEGLLIVAWIILSIGVIGTIFGITIGSIAHSQLMDRVHKSLMEWSEGDRDISYTYEANVTGIYGEISHYFHYMSPICLGLGIFFNMLFIILNYSTVA